MRKFQNEITYLENEIDSLKEEQLRHYHGLLQLGLDPRQDGLIWIIKSIWLLGENINMNKFP